MKKMDKLEIAFQVAVPLTVLVLTGFLGYYAVVFANSVIGIIA